MGLPFPFLSTRVLSTQHLLCLLSAIIMKLYTCALHGDELFTDAQSKFKEDESIHCYTFETLYTSEKYQDYSAACGANASAEEAAEELEQGVKMGLDFTLSNPVEESDKDAKMFKQWLKEYTTELTKKKELEGDAEKELKKKAQAFFTHFLPKVKKNEIAFFESSNDNGGEVKSIILVEWWEDAKGGQAYAFMPQFNYTKL